jgi:voltage-gated potassium channel
MAHDATATVTHRREPMKADEPVLREHGNAYEIFILVLTVFSLALMVVQLLPLDEQTRILVTIYDNVVCVIFLVDFAMNLAGSRPRRAYFIGARGWLDLLGSIPSFGFFPYTALFRLARLSRLARITRLLRGQAGTELVRDVVKNRGQYATFITVLSAGIVLTTASILVLEFESQDADANIKNGGDALWWAVVTITTVGYGDRYPVTMLGRLTGFAVMIAGVGIIGALASILASLLVTSPDEDEAASAESAVSPSGAAVAGSTAPAGPAAAGAPMTSDAVAAELARLREEIAALRASQAGGTS